MNNPEALATLGIQETGRKLTKKKEKNTQNYKDEENEPNKTLWKGKEFLLLGHVFFKLALSTTCVFCKF